MNRFSVSAITICLMSAMALWAEAARGETLPAREGGPAPIDLQRIDLAPGAIQIDGKLTEPVWRKVPAYGALSVIEPDLQEPARYATRTQIFYTDKGLYVGIFNEQPLDTLVERLSARDSGTTRDGVRLVIDTSGEGLYGYFFEVNLGGAVGDGIVLPERKFQREWDGPWRSATARTDKGWTAEMFLPWSMMSMPRSEDGSRRMGISVDRKMAQLNERWAWPALPATQPKFMSALQPVLVKQVAPKQEYSIFPYLSSTTDHVREDEDVKAGVDLFWRPSANFLLSATVNPDFGQVEADDVVVNLSAYETFFPEKRLFFLENQEIFITSPRASRGMGPPGGGGQQIVTLVNTRRIGASVVSRRDLPDYYPGLSLDEFQRNQPVDLLGAAKATMQSGNFRFGILTAFEDDTSVKIAAGGTGNHTAFGRDFAIARAVYEEGTGGGRRSVGAIATLVDHPNRKASTWGVDGHLLTNDGTWEINGQLLGSAIEGTSGVGGFADLQYSPERGTTHSISLDYFDQDVDVNDFGYLRRNDLTGIGYTLSRRDAGGERVRDSDFSVGAKANVNHEHRLVDGSIELRSRLILSSNSRVFSSATYNLEQWDDRNTDGNGSFKVRGLWDAGLSWGTDFARKVSYELGIDFGSDTVWGTNRTYQFSMLIRPNDRFNGQINLRYIDRDSWLIWRHDRVLGAYKSRQWRPRVNLSTFFSARQELKLQVEWAGVKAWPRMLYQVPAGDGWLERLPAGSTETARNFSISDLTVQLRYRWEMAPLSDLFVVYSRGGYIEDFDDLRGFDGIFGSAFNDPEIETLIIKLRYRFGS